MSDADLLPKSTDKKWRAWAMAIHLSQFAHFVVPLGGFIAPIVIWQIQKEEMPELNAHGRNVANWLISFLIYGIISALLIFVLIGFALLGVLGVLAIIFPIIGAIKANEGITWKYPGAIEFFKE